MKNIPAILAVIAASALTRPALAGDTGYRLLLTMRDGTTAAHPYADHPAITIKNGRFTVKTATQSVDYPAKSIARFRLTDSYAAPTPQGDVNRDGTVDVADIATVITVMAGTADSTQATAADVNGDGATDVADIAKIISLMAEN